MVISPVVGHGHVGEKMGARTGGHGVARVDSDHAECEGVYYLDSVFFSFCDLGAHDRATETCISPVGQYDQNFRRPVRALRAS